MRTAKPIPASSSPEGTSYVSPAPWRWGKVEKILKVPEGRLTHAVTCADKTYVLTITSEDGMNRLTRNVVTELTNEIKTIASAESPKPLIITGDRNFSAGADLNEINALTGPEAHQFSALGQELMHAVASYPAPVIAAIEGHCMGGGLDLALACHRRIAATSAVFGHRGAALGLITGWGGTQRLPRLIGKGRALELFIAAEKLDAQRALEIGLINALADNSVAEAKRQLAENGETRRTQTRQQHSETCPDLLG
ncbi:MAG: enoyl-CoA hydratase/isomerase family protein [Candidatus Sulfotelmatobacter sp.]